VAPISVAVDCTAARIGDPEGVEEGDTMPDQVEIPVETLQERINDVREELEGSEHKAGSPSWVTFLALTTALMAVLAAIAGLLEGRAADEALLKANDAVYYQALAVDAWGEFQADSIKAVNETNVVAVLGQLNAPATIIATHTSEATRRKTNQAQSRDHAERAEHERDLAREKVTRSPSIASVTHLQSHCSRWALVSPPSLR